MKNIIQLDKTLINKISAGEVVERPLSIVKELMENAIDALATIITVEIEDGGLTKIRVTDNGGGIPPEDLPLAFARHATSKITSFDDLMKVETLGFRGEALSSIAAVSQVEMITKTASSLKGTRVEIDGGEFISTRDIGAVEGTTLIVSNLFFNTPARRKFLKKPATETGLISQCMEKFALGNINLKLKFISNGKIVFQTNGNGDLKTTILNIYGREVASKMIPVEVSYKDMYIFGLIGKPEIARGNRQHGSIFINGRFIQSGLLTKAIESAMKTMLPNGKFPVYALNLSLPFDKLDVNVHPNKMDVRFQDEDGVFNFFENACRGALEEHNLIPMVYYKKKVDSEPELEQIELQKKLVLEDLASKKKKEAFTPFIQVSEPPSLRLNEGNKHVEINFSEPKRWEPKKTEEVIYEPKPKKSFFFNYQILGLIFSTYWLVSQDESLYLVDQHAAHERVLYEEILNKKRNENVSSQTLVAPIPLRLTPRERIILNENRDIFIKFGFEISSDENKLEILAVPFLLKGPISSNFFSDLLDKMSESGFSSDSPYTHKTELIAMAACKAAIKAGDKQSESEACALIKQLLTLENPFTCPHGRPTIIEISKKELERRFKR